MFDFVCVKFTNFNALSEKVVVLTINIFLVRNIIKYLRLNIKVNLMKLVS